MPQCVCQHVWQLCLVGEPLLTLVCTDSTAYSVGASGLLISIKCIQWACDAGDTLVMLAMSEHARTGPGVRTSQCSVYVHVCAYAWVCVCVCAVADRRLLVVGMQALCVQCRLSDSAIFACIQHKDRWRVQLLCNGGSVCARQQLLHTEYQNRGSSSFYITQ